MRRNYYISQRRDNYCIILLIQCDKPRWRSKFNDTSIAVAAQAHPPRTVLMSVFQYLDRKWIDYLYSWQKLPACFAERVKKKKLRSYEIWSVVEWLRLICSVRSSLISNLIELFGMRSNVEINSIEKMHLLCTIIQHFGNGILPTGGRSFTEDQV